MKTLMLKPLKAAPKLFNYLEKRGLIKTFQPTKKSLKISKGEDGVVDTIYKTAPRYGTHKLICVGKNSTEIKLTTHPDNEDFIIIDMAENKYKPLYLIISIHKQKVMEQKAKSGSLSAKDILAIELEYNSPTSVFTVLKDVPHCEATLPGNKKHPVFFVTEPSDFEMSRVNMYNYKLTLKKVSF